MALRPFDLIHKSLKKEVVVSMKDGRSYSGTVMSYDENLNLFLSKAKEIDGSKREFKSLVLKGGNIVYISPLKQ